jgi:hypothetical protein
MNRFAVPAALTAAALLVVPAAEAAHITAKQAAEAAKTVTIRKTKRPNGTKLKRSQLTASCKAVKNQVNTYNCRVQWTASATSCTSTMQIYEIPKKGYHARAYNVACVK